MPFLLVCAGIVFLMAAINNKQVALGDLLREMFTGQGSFLNVLALFFVIGSLGAITQLKPVATAFMGLVLLVMVLASSGTAESTSLIGRLRSQLIGG